MRNKRIVNGQFTLRLALLLFCLTAFTTAMLSGLYARYIVKSSGSDGAEVAVMAFNTEYVLQDYIAAPGEIMEIPLTLTNKQGSVVCEVAQSYSARLINVTGNLPLTVEYYKVEGNSTTKVDAIQGTFSPGVEEVAYYKILVLWKPVPQSFTLAYEIDVLKIVVEAEQLD